MSALYVEEWQNIGVNEILQKKVLSFGIPMHPSLTMRFIQLVNTKLNIMVRGILNLFQKS